MKRIIDKLKLIYKITDQEKMSEEELRSDMANKRSALFFLSIAALVLTVANIIKQYWFMAFTTLLLAAVLFACSVLSRDYKNRRIVSIICALAIGSIFTYYAVSGQNNGFAILWTLLVPAVGSLLVGFRAGFALSLYFELLFIVLFWTPISTNYTNVYTSTFINRYPILYFTSFAASVFLVVRKDLYKHKAETMAYLDVLTGIYNRRYYEETIRKLDEIGKLKDATIFMIDVNRLKYTNDNYGHSAGDALLISVADYLKSVFSEDDYVCRLGGDEFGIITLASDEQTASFKEKLDAYIFKWQGKIVPEPSLSSGIIKVREYANCSIEEIERFADESMYKAKELYYRNSGVDRRMG